MLHRFASLFAFFAFAFSPLSFAQTGTDTRDGADGTQPDLGTLSESGFIMGPGSRERAIHKNWQSLVAHMKEAQVFEDMLERMRAVLCSEEQNRSVLLVGEPSQAHLFLMAKFAAEATGSCNGVWTVEINANKIEDGHSHVGEVEEYWANQVLAPADRKNVVLYFRSLSHLIGLGTHSHNDTGIEAEYVNNIQSGRMRSVAFIDQYELQRYTNSKHSYVINAFAEQLRIPEMSTETMSLMTQAFLKVFAPRATLDKQAENYLFNTINYYMPNRMEPERSLVTLQEIIRGRQSSSFTISHSDVRSAVMKLAQVPEWIMTREYSVLKALPEKIEKDVVGVKYGKEDLFRLMRLGYAAGKTDNKPVATSLFVGPTGTGKTYLAERFAAYLGMPQVVIDMTAFKSDDSLDRFIDIVANHLVVHPWSVYVFEEIDKAAVEVLDRLFFMLDEGVFYDKFRRPLFARGAFIIATTNAAEDVIIKHKDALDLKKKVQAELLKHFRPSFLNRFAAITPFLPFTDAEYLTLSSVMVAKKGRMLGDFYRWQLSAEPAVAAYVAKYGQSPIYGARPMERLVENVIGDGIAHYQLERNAIAEGAKIAITKGEAAHEFAILVSGDSKKLTYTVTPDGSSGPAFFRKLAELMRNHPKKNR